MIPRVLQDLIGWLHVLVGIGGVVVCAMCSSRSRWTWLLMGGFAVETLVAAAYRVVTLLVTIGSASATALGGAYLVVSLLGLAGRTAIVAGLAGLLSEMGRPPKPAPGVEP